MEGHYIYVIYCDGEPMESNKAGIKRNCYDRIGSAKSIVTGFCHDIAHDKTGHYYGEEYETAKEGARKHYQIMKYGAIEEVQ